MKRLFIVLGTSLFVLFAAGPANAEQVTLTFVGVVGNHATDGTGGYAGVMQWTGPTHLAQGTVGTFPGTGSGPSFNTFCMDATHFLHSTDLYNVIYATPGTVNSWDNVTNLGNSATTATAVLELFGTFFDGLATKNNPAFGGKGLSVTDQNAAFQDAIWLLENPSQNVGASSDSAAVVALADYFVNNFGTTEATNVVIFQSTDGGQDQISVIDPVPVPPSMVLFGLGSLGFLATAWRRTRGAIPH